MAEKKIQTTIDNNSLDIRLAVVETKIDTLTDFIQDHKDNLKELTEAVQGTKQRLDKQNGTLPHLVENMANLTKEVSIISKKLTAHQSQLSSSLIYRKMVWGILGLIGTVCTGIAIEFIIHR